ncbi:hypothetical protein GCM10023321_73010 [Pseudonocardia eucalypti]|uniref:Trypsin-like peptidase n=1 Tax=Pseudonocardia eucalypti TaxID=648755 RepID=A0ABP9R7M9_9PSEU|nr:hypothetical protein [Pseudonocardia eucalypti]
MRLNSRRLRRRVLPVRNPGGVIGTATVVAPGLALTALHVITRDGPATLSVGEHARYPVAAVQSLPLAGYRDAGELARRSQRYAEHLTGGPVDHALSTVDLALLTVPGLPGPAVSPRGDPVSPGEHLVVPGYPGGYWSVNHGPVVGTDGADFAVRMLLGPGASGAPALDLHNRLAGVVTLDHHTATICVGPPLVSTFLYRFLTPRR